MGGGVPGRSQIPHEPADGTVERIILVAGHHVRGAGNLNPLRLRDQLPQLSNAVVTDDLTAGSADDQDGDPYLAHRCGHAREHSLVGSVFRTSMKGRIPMPIPAAIGTETQLALQTAV